MSNSKNSGSKLEILPEYTPVTYYATFIADGIQVGDKVPFTVENGSINEPAVPAKDGYTGKWSDYIIGITDITVNAIYTQIEESAAVYKLPVLGDKSAPYKTAVTVSVSLNDVPAGAKVFIGGKEANVSGNTYSADLGQLSSSKTVSVEVKQGSAVLDSSTLTVKVDTGFFDKLSSFFSNFLFNGFKWKNVTVKF